MGRFSAWPGWGIHTLRTGDGCSPWVWTRRRTSCALQSRFAVTAVTVGPSTPVALVLSIGLSWSRRRSRGIWWAHEVHVSVGSLPAVAGILSSAVATGDFLPGSVSRLDFLAAEGPCCPVQVPALRPPSPCTRRSRAQRTRGPSDFRRLVTRDWRGARWSHRDRSSWWAASEAVGSPMSTTVPWSACWGSEPRKSPPTLPCHVYAGVAFPVGGQGRPLRPRSISGR
jgi:hypothetical protein